jgi:hypothetical protein
MAVNRILDAAFFLAIDIDRLVGFERFNSSKEKIMSLEKSVEIMFGSLVLLSVALTVFVSPTFIWLTAFVGANLIQQAITGLCPAAHIMHRLGVRSERELALQTQQQ